MAQSSHERIGEAIAALNVGLHPFVERGLRTLHGDRSAETAAALLRAAGGLGDAARDLPYNTLVTAWPELSKLASSQPAGPVVKQAELI